MVEATILSQKETELLLLQQTRVERSIARISDAPVTPRAPNSSTRCFRNPSTLLNNASDQNLAPRKRGRPKKVKEETATDDVILLDMDDGEGPSTSSATRI
ncbi:hypothetical protein L3Y34_011004 [Caenorhabditis briggsae]|uniref:Uncharacterized protein n=1 Tax=Caenorhabditis briggsae TaxID=6238 RepID=A0AAE9CTF5_CAEBR|nr:hypothetical protein L3Y34_011004 [Caenorhabditis briggsae]